MGHFKGPEKPAERAPNGQIQNNVSNKINKIALNKIVVKQKVSMSPYWQSE